MQFTIAIIAAVAAMASALPQAPAPTAAPTCTKVIRKEPPVETDCTFFSQYATVTSYTDCAGCALSTEYLGVGLPCRTETTIPGLAVETEVACF